MYPTIGDNKEDLSKISVNLYRVQTILLYLNVSFIYGILALCTLVSSYKHNKYQSHIDKTFFENADF